MPRTSAAGPFIPGTLAHSLDGDAMLESSYNTDLQTATRRLLTDPTRRGTAPEAARAEIISRYGAGEVDLMPQHARISARLRGAR